MAGNGISINILADVREAVRGADNVADAMQDVADVLRDVAEEGGDTTDRMERDFKDLSRTADRESDELRKKFRDAYKDVKRASADTADDGQRDLGKIKDGAGELSNEFGSNLGEAVSNFRGDLSDLGQIGQDTLGGLASTLSGAGPAGIVGGAALAVTALGVGGLVGAIKEADEAAKELKKRAGEIASEWISAGDKIIEASAMQSAIQGILGDEEQMKKADDLVRKLGVDMPTAIRILAGDQNALTDLEGRYQEKLTERNKLEEMIDDNRGRASEKTREQRKALREWIEAYESEASVFSTASDLFKVGTDAQSDSLLAYIDNAKDATVQTDKLGNQLYTLPDGKQIVLDADTGRATLDLNEFKGNVDKVPKEKAVTFAGTVDLSEVERRLKNYRPPTITVPARISVGSGISRRDAV